MTVVISWVDVLKCPGYCRVNPPMGGICCGHLYHYFIIILLLLLSDFIFLSCLLCSHRTTAGGLQWWFSDYTVALLFCYGTIRMWLFYCHLAGVWNKTTSEKTACWLWPCVPTAHFGLVTKSPKHGAGTREASAGLKKMSGWWGVGLAGLVSRWEALESSSSEVKWLSVSTVI